MIFLAYNYFKYRISSTENYNYRDWVISVTEKFFPGEEYILPYSQYSRKQLVEKLKCNDSLIKGFFNDDLPIIMKFCNKLLFFPTENNYIGSGMLHEIVYAKKENIPIFCYNKSTENITENFNLESTKFYEDIKMYNIFCRKVVFS